MEMAKIHAARTKYHQRLIESGVLSIDPLGIASFADIGDSKKAKAAGGPVNVSGKVAKIMCEIMGVPVVSKKLDGQRAGKLFENITTEYIEETFPALSHLRPGRWVVRNLGNQNPTKTSDFAQYEHLALLKELADSSPVLQTTLGTDYLVAPDIVVSRVPCSDDELNQGGPWVDDETCDHADLRAKNGGREILHASISAKWTMRSDRAQNSRTEALNLIRNRKGHLPHIMVVTGEPLPSRLASLALGTGDIDCVYHAALFELMEAISRFVSENEERADLMETMHQLVDGKRLKDISDLLLDLAV